MRHVPVALSALALALALAGCSQTFSICEVTVDGIDACIGSGVGGGFCKSAWDGIPSDKDTTTCASLGYTVNCPGVIEEIGGNYTAKHGYSVKDEAECEPIEDAVFADNS